MVFRVKLQDAAAVPDEDFERRVNDGSIRVVQPMPMESPLPLD